VFEDERSPVMIWIREERGDTPAVVGAMAPAVRD
jgi:hypothetical protein